MRFHPPASRRLAFTLIELLVVISIIALLVAMTLPVMQSAREAARRATCSVNMRQIITATLVYADESGSFVPGTSIEGWGPAGWDHSYMPAKLTAPRILWDRDYISNTLLMRCPSRVDRPMLGNLTEGLTYVRDRHWTLFRSCYSFIGSGSPTTIGSASWDGNTAYMTRLARHDRGDFPLLADVTSDELYPNGGWLWMRKSSHFNPTTGMPDGGNAGRIDGSIRWLAVDPTAGSGNQPLWNINWQFVMTPRGFTSPIRTSTYYFTNPGNTPTGPRRGTWSPPP